MLDDLLEIAKGHSPKEYRNMESTLHYAMKLLSKLFLQLLDQLSSLPNFRKLWLGVLSCMEKYMNAKLRGKRNEKLQELIPELLKNMLLILNDRGVLAKKSALENSSLWEMTWIHVQGISSSLKEELFPEKDPEHETELKTKSGESVMDSEIGFEEIGFEAPVTGAAQ